MLTPTLPECRSIFDEYKTFKNIREHCEKVSKVSVFLAERLRDKNIKTDLDLVRKAALLHDAMKMATLEAIDDGRYYDYVPTEEEVESWKKLKEKYKGMHESEIIYEVLKNRYPEFALFLKKESEINRNPKRLRSWEEKVVHYSDWRVQGTKIVPLKDRLKYFEDKYKDLIKLSPERFELTKAMEMKAEKEILSVIGIEPEELSMYMGEQ